MSIINVELSSCAGPGASVEDQVEGAIEQYGIILFGKSWCPFCLELIDTFTKSKGVDLPVVNIDTLGNAKAVHAALTAKTNQKTVPYVFINKEFIGGCNDTKALDTKGELDKKLGSIMTAEASKGGDEKVSVQVEAVPSADLPSYAGPGSPVKEQLLGAVASNAVVMFGKSWCPFCLELVDTFKALGAPLAVFNIDTMPNSVEVHEALKELTQQKTVPYVYIGQEFVGGCNSTKELQSSGQLDAKLSAALKKGDNGPGAAKDVHLPPAFVPAASPNSTPVYHCLFNFPDTVDNHVIRGVAVMVFVLATFAAAFRNDPKMHYMVLGVFVDFVARLLGGAQASPLGSLAILLVARLKPELGAGPPKQFAVMVGVIFSGLGSLLYWVDTKDDNIAGLVIWATLAAFAALEGFYGFCAGCWAFGHMIRLGLVPRNVYTIHLNHKPEVEYMWEDNMRVVERSKIPQPQEVRRQWPGKGVSATDLIYKTPKTVDFKRQDFNPIKHMKIGLFNALLGITGLAIMYKGLAAGYAKGTPYQILVNPAIWQALAVFAGTLYTLFASLLLLKVALHPHKVWKEFQHPTHGGAYSVPFILLVMFSMLANDAPGCEGCATLARVLFWCGAGPMMALAIMRVGDLIATLRDEEHINPAWIMPPVGLFLAALIGPKVDPAYAEAMHFWYAFAFCMWVALFLMTLHKAIVYHILDCRQHPMLYIWVAAPAVGCTGYLSIMTGMAGQPYPFDFFAKMMLFIALAVFLFLGWGFLRGYFGSCCFAVTEWAYSFPFIALTLALCQYHSYWKGPLTAGLAYTGICWSTWNTLVIGLHTVTAIARGGVFRDPGEWSPMASCRLCDEALDMYLERLPAALGGLDAQDLSGIARFVMGWRQFSVALYEQVVHHKNGVLFPAANGLMAGIADKFIGLNARHADKLAGWHKVLDQLFRSTDPAQRTTLLAQLVKEVLPWAEHLRAQMEEEHEDVSRVVTKRMPIKLQIELFRKVWESTPEKTWAEVMPWVVRHLPTVGRRQRYLRTFLWSVPARMQQVGMYIANGVDAVIWADITRDFASLIPHGMAGWTYYL